MATKKVTKQAAGKKPPAKNKPTPALPSKSATIELPVLMMALSWQEGSAAYQFPTTTSQRQLGIDPTCPQCPARTSCEKGIVVNRTLPEGNQPQGSTPTRAMVFEFATDALADAWFAADGAKFDLVKVLNKTF